MKKILFTMLMLLFCSISFGQVFYSSDHGYKSDYINNEIDTFYAHFDIYQGEDFFIIYKNGEVYDDLNVLYTSGDNYYCKSTVFDKCSNCKIGIHKNEKCITYYYALMPDEKDYYIALKFQLSY